jgi:hypothetical protein
MKKLTIEIAPNWQALSTLAMAIIIGCLLVTWRPIKDILWMNAAAISLELHRPGLYIPVAVCLILLCIGAVWKGLWGLNQSLLRLANRS